MMDTAYEEFPTRSQSPYNMARGAHPGAVLLSPHSSMVNMSSMVSSPPPRMDSPIGPGPLAEMLDRQPLNATPSSLPPPSKPKSHLDSATNLSSLPLSKSKSQQQLSTNAAGSAPLTSSVLKSFHSSSILDHFDTSNATTPSYPNQRQQRQFIAPHDPNLMFSFSQDINQLCSWISVLSSTQQDTVMDSLLPLLKDDVLKSTKLKLDSLINSKFLSPQVVSPIPSRGPNYMNPSPTRTLDTLLTNDSSDANLNERSVPYKQWSIPPSKSSNVPIHDYIKEMHHQERPKSVEPHMIRTSYNTIKPKRSLYQQLTVSDNGVVSNEGYHQANESSIASTASSPSMNPKVLTDPKLLVNLPAWLKSLRLHKYSEALGGKTWLELIYLDDRTLEELGVSALGARRKLLKAFTIVREYKDNGLIDKSAFPTEN